jgi:vacuolar-type H+-ATPase subunit H
MSLIDDDPVFETAGEHEALHLIRQAIEVVANARPLPLSSSVRIEPEEVLSLLDEAVAQLPEELRAARWLLKERDEHLAKMHLEGEQILDEARSRAEKMVDRAEIVRQAKRKSQQLVTDAEDEARKKKHEAEDWCDQQLAKFEIVLDRTTKMVHAGRDKLRSVPQAPAAPLSEEDQAADDAANAFFDQDL